MVEDFEQLTGAPAGRFDQVRRDYDTDAVRRLRGSVAVEHSLARRGAEQYESPAIHRRSSLCASRIAPVQTVNRRPSPSNRMDCTSRFQPCRRIVPLGRIRVAVACSACYDAPERVGRGRPQLANNKWARWL